ncbi:MarR family transcriptional regulator [Rhodovulum iodosum]|nr:MarR family transcriptional regulator [Rhodovulum robiginosum]
MEPTDTFLLDEFLPYQLCVAANQVSRSFAERFRRDFGISIAEWRVLAHLSRAVAVSVREIHACVDMDKSKISRAAARLEQAGYVTKRENPGDRRLVELELTATGRALVAELLPVALQFQRDLLRRLGAKGPAVREAMRSMIREAPGAG